MTFTLGSGPTAQTCSGTTDDFGKVSCDISPVDQPVSDVSVTASYDGSSYETPATSSTPVKVTEPTTLTVHSATSDYADATTVSGVLTDTVTNHPISGEAVALSLERPRVVHSGDRRHGHGVVQRHARRGGGDLSAHGTVSPVTPHSRSS